MKLGPVIVETRTKEQRRQILRWVGWPLAVLAYCGFLGAILASWAVFIFLIVVVVIVAAIFIGAHLLCKWAERGDDK